MCGAWVSFYGRSAQVPHLDARIVSALWRIQGEISPLISSL